MSAPVTRLLRGLGLAGLLLALGGCSTHMSVGARNLRYPAATTRVFYAPDARPLGKDDYQVLKSFSFAVRSWSVLGGAIPLGSEEHDISEQLNALVAENGGDAIANLTFVGNDPSHLIPIGNLNYLPPFCILPAWMTMEVTGDVVKFR